MTGCARKEAAVARLVGDARLEEDVLPALRLVVFVEPRREFVLAESRHLLTRRTGELLGQS